MYFKNFFSFQINLLQNSEIWPHFSWFESYVPENMQLFAV